MSAGPIDADLPSGFNMAAYCIGRAAASRPNAPALIVIADAGASRPAEIWTFAELEAAVLRVAGGLAQTGLSPGARILIRLENTSALALLFFGAIAGGFVPLPTSTQLTAAEARFLLEDSAAEAVALGRDFGIDNIPGGVRVFEAGEIGHMITRGPRGAYADTAADDAVGKAVEAAMADNEEPDAAEIGPRDAVEYTAADIDQALTELASASKALTARSSP